MGKRLRDQVGLDFAIRLFPDHFDIPAKGYGRDAIIGSSDFLSDQTGAKTQGEFFNPDAEYSGN